MTVKAKTRAMLAAELEELRRCLEQMRMQHDAALQGGKDLRTNLDDVKQRLAFAEAERQRMHGYIQRVQEDDVVREELVTVGEPDGEQRQVPKRKPTPFCGRTPVPSEYREDAPINRNAYGERRERRRHWATY